MLTRKLSLERQIMQTVNQYIFYDAVSDAYGFYEAVSWGKREK